VALYTRNFGSLVAVLQSIKGTKHTKNGTTKMTTGLYFPCGIMLGLEL
jgi:hypothetical protein